jgi:hypothetical protein
VRQPRHRLRLAQQALLPDRAPAAVGLDELERHLAVERRIDRGDDDAHRTGADRAEDDVAPDLGAARDRGRVARGCERRHRRVAAAW